MLIILYFSYLPVNVKDASSTHPGGLSHHVSDLLISYIIRFINLMQFTIILFCETVYKYMFLAYVPKISHIKSDSKPLEIAY